MSRLGTGCEPPGGSLEYGCYCGLGATGGDPEPVDGFDAACRRHDLCYAGLPRTGKNDEMCHIMGDYRFAVAAGKVGKEDCAAA